MIFGGKLILGLLGWLLGKWVGLLIGLFIGHWIDSKLMLIQSWNPFRPIDASEKAQLNDALIDTAFAIMGHLAKADGRVCESEIAQAEALMNRMGLDADKRQHAIKRFNDGKSAQFDLDQCIAGFAHQIRHRRHFVLVFMEMLLSVALADGHLSAEEQQILMRVANGLGISQAHFQQILRMLMAQAQFQQQAGAGYGQGSAGQAASSASVLEQAYTVLGITAQASDSDVKKAYRRLMSQHHPDKLSAQGAPEEMIRVATEKSAQISKAYDVIKKARGIK